MRAYRERGAGPDRYLGNGRGMLGYRLFEIYEVYEYQVTQYNPVTGQGGLFVDEIHF